MANAREESAALDQHPQLARRRQFLEGCPMWRSARVNRELAASLFDPKSLGLARG